jgi:uncharacterized Zn finger protein
MARARLHVICGNCGCNDEFRFEIVPEGHDVTDTEPKFEPAVWIWCDNCSTLHNLSDTVPETKGE